MDVLFPRDDKIDDTISETDPITHPRLEKIPLSCSTYAPWLSAFTGSVPDDHAPVVLLAHDERVHAAFIPEQTWSVASHL